MTCQCQDTNCNCAVCCYCEQPRSNDDRTWPECLDPNAPHNRRSPRQRDCPNCDTPLANDGGCYYPECNEPQKPRSLAGVEREVEALMALARKNDRGAMGQWVSDRMRAAAEAALKSRSDDFDWVVVAKLAGRLGIRYRTNTALLEFLSSVQPTRAQDDQNKTIEILRRALAWHGDPARMATTREEWQQTIDEAIAWVKANPEEGRPSFSSLVGLQTIVAWNTRPDPVKLGQDHMSLLDILLNVRDAFVSGYKPSDRLLDCIDDAITAYSKVRS